jgi:hypothetical protein
MSRLDLRIGVSLPGPLRRAGLPRPEPDASAAALMTVRPSRTSATTQRSWPPDARMRSRESHPKDRPTCADIRSDQAAAIPRISHDQRLTAASDGIWLQARKQDQGHRSVPELAFCWWQVLGSNQRRLSRRFYRPFPQTIGIATELRTCPNGRVKPSPCPPYVRAGAGGPPGICGQPRTASVRGPFICCFACYARFKDQGHRALTRRDGSPLCDLVHGDVVESDEKPAREVNRAAQVDVADGRGSALAGCRQDGLPRSASSLAKTLRQHLRRWAGASSAIGVATRSRAATSRYLIDDDASTIHVLDIDHRRDAYRP